MMCSSNLMLHSSEKPTCSRHSGTSFGPDDNNGLAPSSPLSSSAPAKPMPKLATPLPLPLLLLLPATGAEVLAAEATALSLSRRQRRKVTERTRFRLMMACHASALAWNVVGPYLS